MELVSGLGYKHTLKTLPWAWQALFTEGVGRSKYSLSSKLCTSSFLKLGTFIQDHRCLDVFSELTMVRFCHTRTTNSVVSWSVTMNLVVGDWEWVTELIHHKLHFSWWLKGLRRICIQHHENGIVLLPCPALCAIWNTAILVYHPSLGKSLMWVEISSKEEDDTDVVCFCWMRWLYGWLWLFFFLKKRWKNHRAGNGAHQVQTHLLWNTVSCPTRWENYRSTSKIWPTRSKNGFILLFKYQLSPAIKK